MKFAVMGAGAVGGYFGGLLAQNGHEVTLIARGEHLNALQKNGLTVKSFHGDFHLKLNAVEDPKETGKVDVVLFTPKAYATKNAVEQIVPILDEDSLVINLQNGIDNEQIMADVIGEKRVLGGLTYIETTIEAPGIISQKSKKRDIVFGEMNGQITERAKILLEVFKDAGIPTVLSDNIQRDIWKKFMFLSSFSAITTITESTAGEVIEFKETDHLLRKLLEEVYLLAKSYQIPLTEEDIEDSYQFAKTGLEPTTKSSMQRDFEKKKPLELDSLSGAVVKYAKMVNLKTPYHKMVYGVLTLKEKNYTK